MKPLPRFPRRTFLLAGATSIGALVVGGGSYAVVAQLGRSQGEPLPRYAYRSKNTARAYRIALTHGDLLAALPCYCGCDGLQPPHQNLRECYLTPEGGFEEHAAWCEVCQAETLDAKRWADEGIPPPDIHRRIDNQYRT